MKGTERAGRAPGEHLVEELKWVHGMLRDDLAACRQLAVRITEGTPSRDVAAEIRSMRTRSPLWQLRVNCLRYCQFVHHHHGLEDVALFPALRRYDPALSQTVDKLEADHRKVSDLLDTVEALAGDLAGDQPPHGGPAAHDATGEETRTREQLVAALDDLATHLLEHLDFEERSIIPTLRQMHSWHL